MADWTPQSRAEEILFSTINGEPYDGLPQSRIEELLLELKDVIESGGGGGGGTDNYNLLKNLPQINGQTVKGNMSGTTLGLVNMVMGKDLSTNDYTNADKAIVDSVTADLADKVDKITGKGLSENDYTDADKAIVGGVTSALADKVDKVTGKGLSTNDYDNTAKGIVDGVTSALAGKVSATSVGSANGVAELDANGKVPSAQLPSYVDDTVEGYLNSVDGKFYADSSYTTEITGETGKIYVTLDTNKTYRWSGSGFVEISESLALGETSSTAYAGDKGKANADAIAGIKNGTSINSFSAVETALAGKANSSDLGDKSNLTTTDKSNAVSAINEVNFIAGTLYYSIIATDTKDFISKLVARIDTDIASKPGYTIYNVFAFHHGVQAFFGMVVRRDVHGYSFCFSTESSDKQYQGFVDIPSETVVVHEYISTDKSQTLVNLNSAYDADTDWNIVKQGNICVMNMRNLKDIPVGNTVIGTIPVGFRPEWGFYEYVYSLNKDVHLGFNIADDGDLQIINQTGAVLSGTVYVNRNVTYFTA